MKIIHVVLALLMIVTACMAVIMLGPEPAASTGISHPEIPAMRSGGDGAARFLPVATASLIMNSAVIALFSALLYMGISPARRNKRSKTWILSGTVASMLVWWAIYGYYTAYLRTGETEFILGFPMATAFVVYAIWLASCIFVIAYVVGFRDFVLPQEDEDAFHELVARYRNTEGDN